VSIIVEAASSVLEEEGFEGFNTNAAGANAGVSIGSVYQYFTSKEALLSAITGARARRFYVSLRSYRKLAASTRRFSQLQPL